MIEKNKPVEVKTTNWYLIIKMFYRLLESNAVVWQKVANGYIVDMMTIYKLWSKFTLIINRQTYDIYVDTTNIDLDETLFFKYL